MGGLNFSAHHGDEGSLVFTSIPCTFVVLWTSRKVEGQNKKQSNDHFLKITKKLKFLSLPQVKLRLGLVDGRCDRPRQPGVTFLLNYSRWSVHQWPRFVCPRTLEGVCSLRPRWAHKTTIYQGKT